MPRNYQDEQDSLGTRKSVGVAIGGSPRVERRGVAIFFSKKLEGKKKRKRLVVTRLWCASEWAG